MLQVQTTKWINDAGADIVAAENARQAFKDTASSTCKREHPSAVKQLTKGLRKPYTDCVDEKMARYDDAIDAQTRTDRMNAALKIDADVAAAQSAAKAESVSTSTPSAINESSASGAANIVPSNNVALYIGGSVIAVIALLLIFLGYRNANKPVEA